MSKGQQFLIRKVKDMAHIPKILNSIEKNSTAEDFVRISAS